MPGPGSTSGTWWPKVLSGCQDVLIEFESCDNIIISFIIYWTTCYRYPGQRKLESVEGSSQVNILCNSYLIHQHIPLIPANILSQVSAHYSSFSYFARRHGTLTSDPCEDRGPTDWWWREEANLGCLSQPGPARHWTVSESDQALENKYKFFLW